jgi:hypothetical protein
MRSSFFVFRSRIGKHYLTLPIHIATFFYTSLKDSYISLNYYIIYIVMYNNTLRFGVTNIFVLAQNWLKTSIDFVIRICIITRYY